MDEEKIIEEDRMLYNMGITKREQESYIQCFAL